MSTPEQWEERFARPGYWVGAEPAPFLVEALPFLPRGRAIDVASGEGRNAVLLAVRGWQVTAIDRASAGHAKTEALAAERGVATSRRSFAEWQQARNGLVLVEADLERVALPAAAFDAVVCINFLERSLFPAMERALRPGGVLVYQTYTVHQLDYPEGPRDLQYLLQPDELRNAFPALETLYYSESNSGKGIACLLARRPALADCL